MSSAACCIRHAFEKSRFLGLERKVGGSFHLNLNSSSGLLIAYQSAMEGSVGAFGGQIFSQLLSLFDYQQECDIGCNRPDWCGPPEQNAEAAGTALLLTTCIPFLICGALYSSLHYFYPCDMERIFEQRRVENEAAGSGLSTELTNV